MREFDVVKEVKYVIKGRIVHHQFNASGGHRLSTSFGVGDVTSYLGVAEVDSDGLMIYGTTDYYSGTFPRVFTIDPAK